MRTQGALHAVVIILSGLAGGVIIGGWIWPPVPLDYALLLLAAGQIILTCSIRPAPTDDYVSLDTLTHLHGSEATPFVAPVKPVDRSRPG